MPPTPQTKKINSGEGRYPAICEGVKKIPDPMHDPTATMVSPYKLSSFFNSLN
jgi:hypothetical protein